MSPMLNPHTNQPDPQKVGAERWGFLISQSNEFPEAVLHLAESSSSSKQQINTNNSNNINILLLVISTFNLSSHLYNHISLFCHSSGGSTLLTKSLQSVILEVLYWNKASVCSDPGRRSAQSFQLQLEWLYMTIDTYHLYIYIYTKLGSDDMHQHQQKAPNLYQCWVLWTLPGGTVLQIRADMRNRLMDLKSRSTPRAFNAIDPKILWFSWCYHSVFFLSEIFWEVLCSGKVMKTLWHQME